jgi:hypothetical protein
VSKRPRPQVSMTTGKIPASVFVVWQEVFPNTVRGLHSCNSAFVKLG